MRCSVLLAAFAFWGLLPVVAGGLVSPSYAVPARDWIIASAPVAGLEIRVRRSYDFVPVKPGERFPEGLLLRFRPDGIASDAPPAILVSDARETKIEVFRGAVIGFDEVGLHVLLGRIRAVVASSGLLLPVKVARGTFEIQSGEAWAEVDGSGDACVAMRKGVGWVKNRDSEIIRLANGKQVDLPRWGASGKARDIDSRWKDIATGFMSAPERNPPPAQSESEKDDSKGIIEAVADTNADADADADADTDADTESASDTDADADAVVGVGSDTDADANTVADTDTSNATGSEAGIDSRANTGVGAGAEPGIGTGTDSVSHESENAVTAGSASNENTSEMISSGGKKVLTASYPAVLDIDESMLATGTVPREAARSVASMAVDKKLSSH